VETARAWFAVLGPLEVWREGKPLRLGASKQRALLAALLLQANRVVSSDRLIEQVWGAAAPPTARNTLHSLVLRLRRLLGPAVPHEQAAAVLATKPPGYILRLDPDQLDLNRFEELVIEGGRAMAAGDPERASALLREGLALWRGPALADVDAEGLRRVALPWLEERRLAALEERIEADLRCGRHASLIGELRTLVAEHPLRERLHGQLMVALYRCGRQTEALAAYRQVRKVLHEDMGLDPAAELQRLERAILTRDPRLDPLAPATPAGHGDGRPRGRPVPAQLPPDIAEFTGRGWELAELRVRISAAVSGEAGAAVVVCAIDGKPGIGKSALAVHLAHELAELFPDGVLYVNLRGAEGARQPPLEVLVQFLHALGVASEQIPSDLDTAVAWYRSVLAARRTLVVLDNAADSAQVRPLLPAGGGCAALVTSRAQLADLDGAEPLSLEVLPREEAVSLLARYVGEQRLSAEPAAAERIVGACGRLPLALRIIGARLRARPAWRLADMAARLADERGRLDELSVGELDVRSSLQLSYHSLDPVERRTFRLLGLLEGPDITAAAAAALTRRPLRETAASLERLAYAQLLESPASGRYQFHDLLRLFAREQAETDEDEAGRRAALAGVLGWYAASAEHAGALLQPAALREGAVEADGGLRFADRRAALDWLEAERANLVAAAAQAAAHPLEPLAAIAWRISSALRGFFDLRKHWADWQAVCEAAVQAARRTGNLAAMAPTLNDLGVIHGQQHRHREAVACLRRSLRICRKVRDRRTEGRVLSNLGIVCRKQGRLRDALDYLGQSLVIRREVGDRRGQATTLNNLGEVYRSRGFDQAAVACYEQSLAICRELGDPRGESITLDGLGSLHRERGRDQEAMACFERALAICQHVGDHYHEARALRGLGLTVAAVHGADAAHPYWKAALDILERLGAPEARNLELLLT
jgi:DNA-binding SARP family transcriptional activator/tetratricopeptide (TPR) repeat protein